MTTRTDHGAAQRRLAAVLLLGLLAGIAWLTVALYQGAFTDRAVVTVRAERAGLQMNEGTVVKLRGVDVGEISSARALPDGTAEITLAMKPEMLERIPDNVEVSLAQLTAFGNKAVLLELPERPSARHLTEGDVLEAGHVSVEVNQVLDDLQQVLVTARPAQVNAALGALATAVDGRGERLGQTLAVADRYLAKINRDLPTLQEDFEKGADVLAVYAEIMPNLLTTLSNASAISRTVTGNADELAETLSTVAAVGNSGGRFLALNGDQLAALLARSTVTTELLAEYSPEFACLLKAQDWYQRRVQPAFGGDFPGVHIMVPLEQGTSAYQSPEHLPNITADDGPNCHGLPGYKGGPLPRSVTHWEDPSGSTWPDQPELNDEPLAMELFGPLATLGGGR